jgi:hypothetical protein
LGKKYVRSSVGSIEKRVFKKPPTVIVPGGSSSRLSTVTVAAPTPPPNNVQFESKNIIAIFGSLSPENSMLDSDTLFRITELLGIQGNKKIDPLDFLIERHLLADPTDDLRLSKLISDTFKGNSKPSEEEISLGSKSLLGTLHWRNQATTRGHLAPNMEGVDRELQSRSFAWAVPLITTWPPPLSMGSDATDNKLWEFKLQDCDLEHDALKSLVEQLEEDDRGVFFAKVCNSWQEASLYME